MALRLSFKEFAKKVSPHKLNMPPDEFIAKIRGRARRKLRGRADA
jgi:hypothetical protein